MELFCVVLIPATAVLLLITFRQKISPTSGMCMLVMSALLIVGGCYWRAKLSQLDGDADALDRVLAWAGRLQLPILSCVIIAILLCVADLFFVKLCASRGDRIAAIGATVMAVLEYINYYHRQLQHFDHMPDFRRLIAGRGFRKSQMCRDLERYRSKGPDGATL